MCSPRLRVCRFCRRISSAMKSGMVRAHRTSMYHGMPGMECHHINDSPWIKLFRIKLFAISPQRSEKGYAVAWGREKRGTEKKGRRRSAKQNTQFFNIHRTMMTGTDLMRFNTPGERESSTETRKKKIFSVEATKQRCNECNVCLPLPPTSTQLLTNSRKTAKVWRKTYFTGARSY